MDLLGVEECLSMSVSSVNFFLHVIYYLKTKRELKYPSPTCNIWNWMTAVYLNVWFWSAVSQTRDREFIELVNYTCNFIVVLTILYCLLLRIYFKDRVKLQNIIVTTGIYCAVLYTHVSHLWSEKVNYNFNSRLTVLIGVVTITILIIWWTENIIKLPHLQLLGWFIILTVIVNLFEALDFHPSFWIFDAHTLWNASAIPLVKLLYKFVLLDVTFLRRERLRMINLKSSSVSEKSFCRKTHYLS